MKMLASVADLEELEFAREGGADILDLKDPARGALGAWEVPALEAAVALARSWDAPRPPLSATVGDQPMRPGPVVEAAERIAATGVDIVKIGFFPEPAAAPCIAALAPLAAGTRLVAVFFADAGLDLGLVDAVAEAGFLGAMLDTADKRAGGLLKHRGLSELSGFVARARERRLLTGLAGSLALADIAPLSALGPDYLGFRGALCGGCRTGRLDPARLRAVRDAVRSPALAGR